MGIYIKGMKMPKDDQKIRFIKLLNGKMYALKETRNGWPLSYLHKVIEVTEPHGRLIDIRCVEDNKFVAIENSSQRWWNGALDSIIDNAPTVIEAEGE